MKTSITAGLQPQQASEIKKEYVGSSQLRKRLVELLNTKVNASRKESISKDAYQNPNWAYLQADARGYERAISEIISLLSDKNVQN